MVIIISTIFLCFFLSGLATLRYYYSLKHSREMTLKGIDALRQLLEIIKLIQQHRALHSGVLNGNQDFKPKLQLIESDLTHRFTTLEQFQLNSSNPFQVGIKSLKARWQNLLNQTHHSAEESFRAHSGMIGRALDGLWEIADKYGLTTNADPDVRILATQMVKTVPELTESLAQIRGLSVQVASRHEISSDKKLQLMYTLTRIEERLSSLQQHFPSSGLSKLQDFLSVVRSGTEDASLREQDPEYLFKESTQVIDQLYDCILNGFKTINTKVNG